MKTIEIAEIIEEHKHTLSSSEIAHIIKQKINDEWRYKHKDKCEDVIE